MKAKWVNLQKLLSPASIVFIGQQQIVKQGIRNCRAQGFQGAIYAVSRSASEIEGIKCHYDINELPDDIDAALLATRGENTIQAVTDLQKKNVAGCVCYAAGFAEVGKSQLQDDLVRAAGEMAIIGPNCYGFINYLDGLSLWPDRHGMTEAEKGIALISQSGNISLNLTMTARSLPVSYILSVGNQAVLDIADYIQVLCEDPRVNAIGVHIEGLKDVTAFSQAAKKAFEKGIPIVALKTGTSDIGSQLTMSHTSSLAGADDLYNALFERLNISRTQSIAGFLETLKLFSVHGVHAVDTLGVLTCSGGESTIVADIAGDYRFQLPHLPLDLQEKLRTKLTTFEHVSNPLDYNTSIWGNEEASAAVFQTFMETNFDVTVLVLDLLDPENGNTQPWKASINAIIKAHHRSKKTRTIVISTLSEGLPSFIRKKLIAHGITPLQGIEEAFSALDAMRKYHLKKYEQTKKMNTQFLFSATSERDGGSYVLHESDGKTALKQFGLSVPKGILVSKLEEIMLSGMKPPYVVKGVHPSLTHKTELGAVQLNVRHHEEVKAAIEKISRNLLHIPESEQLFLIEEMVDHVVAELNIGIKRDPQFGLALVISMGGELVNLLNDSVPLLLPANRTEILQAIHSLKGARLLQGYRGKAMGDIEAVVEAAQAIANYAAYHAETLLELDVNPLLVLPKGQGAIAADALISKTSEENLQIVM